MFECLSFAKKIFILFRLPPVTFAQDVVGQRFHDTDRYVLVPLPPILEDLDRLHCMRLRGVQFARFKKKARQFHMGFRQPRLDL